MKRKSIQFRRSILAAACVLTVSSAFADHASYPTGTYGLYFGGMSQPALSLTDYILAITAPQQNTASVSALVENAAAGASYYGQVYSFGLPSLPSYGGDHPATVTGNSIAATAAGNRNTSSADLSLLRAGYEGQGGLGVAASQLRAGAATQARIDESRIAVEAYGVTPAATAVEGNSIVASAALNQSASSAAGTTPAGYGTWQSGGASIEQDRYSIEARTAGGINVATYQAALQAGQNAGSGASVYDSAIGISLQGGATAAQGLSLKGNTIAAAYAGNTASGIVDAAGGAAFQGSAMVTNSQVDAEGLAVLPPLLMPGFTASNYAPRATALVEGGRVTAEIGTGLASSLRVSDNTVAATSTGNSAGARAADGSVQAGNAVLVDASTVRGGYNDSGARAGVDGAYSQADLYADLGVLNTQVNRSTALTSRMFDSGVAVRAELLQSQSAVSLDGNKLQSAATGNLAGNLIDVRAADFGATAAAANLQSNAGTDIAASQDWTRVTVEGGGYGRYTEVGGTTTLAGNAITADAAGNVGATRVSLQATRMQAVDMESGSAGAMAQAWDGAYAEARGGATASNAQSNTGRRSTIEASVSGSVIGADLGNSFGYSLTSFDGRSPLAAGAVALTGNTVAAQSIGNSAANGVALAGTDGIAHAAVANAQTNDVRIAASVLESGVAYQGGAVVDGSTLTLQGNAVRAAATANQATNTLSAQFASLDVSSSPYSMYDRGGYIDGPGAATLATQGIASTQSNSANVKATNASESGFATAAAIGRNGAADSAIAVQGNQATASAAGNQVRNAIDLDVGTLTRSYGYNYGYDYGYRAPIAETNSLQLNEGDVRAVVAGEDHELSIGAHVKGGLWDANVTVTGNTAAARATANDAANQITVTGGSLAASRGYDVFGYVPSFGGTDFNLVNGQAAYGSDVSAQARDVRIAVEAAGARRDGIEGSTLVVSGNKVSAEARANNAANELALTGFTTLASNASVTNEQHGETRVAARVEDAQLRIRAVDTSISGSQLALKDNAVNAIAVGASATNSLDVAATALQGSQPIYTVLTLSPVEPVATGYAVSNGQSQYGTVSARNESSVRMNLEGSGLAGGAATVSGNSLAAVAQATSASNALNLAGTTIGGVNGSVSSSQSTSGYVSAEQTAPRNLGASFVVQAAGAYAAPVTVSNNGVLASAGQNEAFNSVGVSGSTVAGDYAVLNAQQGSGLVSARAEPGLVGVAAGMVAGGSLAVNGNTVAAKAAFNTAANSLAIESATAAGASATVRNDQSAYGSAAATVGGYESQGAMVGVMQGLYGQGTALNASTANVSGNSISADVAGNTASNALSVAGAATSASYGPAYSVLNGQTNQAALSATVSGSGFAVNSYGLQGSTVAVTGNQLNANATGNAASNVLSLTASPAGYGQGATVSNVQFNNASISAAVRGAMVGVGAAGVGGGSSLVTGNAIAAQAVGNSAVNKLGAR